MHTLSADDREFVLAFESMALTPQDFDHRAHVRLACAYLVQHGTDGAVAAMRDALRAFLSHHGIDPGKFHETMTRAWVLAVRHFMECSPDAQSADELIAANPLLLDSSIMLTHYSARLLFSDEARRGWVEPDLDPIPG